MSAVRFQNRPPHGNQSVSFLPSSSASVIRPTASSNRSPGLSAPRTSTFLISNFITVCVLMVIHSCNITKLFHSVQGNCKVFSFFFLHPPYQHFQPDGVKQPHQHGSPRHVLTCKDDRYRVRSYPRGFRKVLF